jgi:hypothetical protein
LQKQLAVQSSLAKAEEEKKGLQQQFDTQKQKMTKLLQVCLFTPQLTC